MSRILVSIHAFPGGRRPRLSFVLWAVGGFNPRLPGGRRPPATEHRPPTKTVSIHAFRGEGDIDATRQARRRTVSIHAFRGEGDVRWRQGWAENLDVSIHAFRGEGDIRV